MRRLKTVRRPPIYPNEPSHLPCSSLTHPAAVLTPSIGVLRWIRAKQPSFPRRACPVPDTGREPRGAGGQLGLRRLGSTALLCSETFAKVSEGGNPSLLILITLECGTRAFGPLMSCASHQLSVLRGPSEFAHPALDVFRRQLGQRLREKMKAAPTMPCQPIRRGGRYEIWNGSKYQNANHLLRPTASSLFGALGA